jgi:circadian clock protein KaiB
MNMTLAKKKNRESKQSHSRNNILGFRLYISPGGITSERAITNLKTICEKHFRNHYDIEIVDALQDPLRAARDGIEVTPTLVKLSPEPRWKIQGDLSDNALILAAMRGEAKGRRAK